MRNGFVMVFGVYDRLHPGHRAFLGQAKKYGSNLIVVVARDSAVFKLKKRWPQENEKTRLKNVARLKMVSRAVWGDIRQGSYNVIKKYKPDIICLGYDQQWLGRDIKQKMHNGQIPLIKLIKLMSYQPKRFHSSFL